jgi:hypothetical protein
MIPFAAFALACGDGSTPPESSQKLAFTVQPTNVMEGSTIGLVEVTAQDAQGNRISTFAGNVTLSIGANAAGGTLSGTKTVAAVAGVATFTNLSIDKAAAGFTLVATASGMTAATSAAFDVAAIVGTKLYLSPLLDFKLRRTPTVTSSGGVELCLSTMEWTATLAGDMAGTSYTFTLGVKTANNSSGSGNLRAEIIHKRASTETVLAATTFATTSSYEIKTATMPGNDPVTLSGDILLLRVRIVTPSAGLPCVAEFQGPGTDNFIIVPTTTVQGN